MRKLKGNQFIIQSFLGMALALSSAYAADSLSYSGRLVQANGAPVSGPVTIRAQLAYTNALTTILCTEDIPNVVLTKGVFHLKLNLDCSASGLTLNQVLAQAPVGESVAIQIRDVTNSKSYSFQAIHSIPYANVSQQLAQMGATNNQVLKWNSTTNKWEPGSIAGAGTVTSVSVSSPLNVTNGSTTPAITISQANGTTSGYLSSADWTTFNSKSSLPAGGTTAHYFRGDGSWQTLNTAVVPENVANLYFTNARALGVPLAGLVLTNSAIANADTFIEAFGKAQGQINALATAQSNYLLKGAADTLSGNVSLTSVITASVTGDIIVNSTPLTMTSAVNKAYVDTQRDTRLAITGGTLTGDLTLDEDLIIKGSGNTNYVTVKAHATTANYNFVLPQTAGSAGYVLRTDGSGNLSWIDPTVSVNSSGITDGSIVDDDINASANIAQSKISGLTTALTGKVSTTLASGNILVGSAGGVATAVAVSGDATLSNAGALALTTTGVTGGTYTSVTVDTKGRVTGGSNPAAVKSLVATLPLDLSGTADDPVITLPPATTTNDGYLKATDWAVFNAKQAALTSSTDLQGDQLRLYNGVNYVEIKSPVLGGNVVFTLPTTDGDANQVLQTDGNGILSWVAQPIFSGAAVTDGDIPQAKVNGLVTALAGKEPTITAGDSTHYYRGDKTFVTLNTAAVPESGNLYFTEERAKAASVIDAIVNGVLDVAPSQNAVYDALALKISTSGGTLSVGTINGIPTPVSDDDVSNKYYVDSQISYSVGIGNLVPAGAKLLMKTCTAGFTENGATGGGPGGVTCDGATCKICENGATATKLAASTIVVMEACPSGWTNLGAGGGPGAAGRYLLDYRACQSPASVSTIPQNSRLMMATCPSEWKDLGPTTTGPSSATCDGVDCRICETPGSLAHSYLMGTDATSTSAGGNALIVGGTGGSTSGNGGAVTIIGGRAVSGNGGGVSISGNVGAVNGNGGSIILNSGAKAGTGVDGAITLNATVAGYVGVGTSNPVTKLDVYGNNTGATIASTGATDPTTNFRVGRGSVGVNIGTIDNGTSYIQNRQLNDNSVNYGLALQPNGGNVSIGTVNTNYPLSVYRSAASVTANLESGGNGNATLTRYAGFTNAAAARVWGAGINQSSGSGEFEIYDYTASASRLFIDTSGNVAIGNTSASYTLHVNGSVAGTSAYVNTSDARLKRDVKRIPDALKKLTSLDGVFYHFKTEEYPDMNLSSRREMGVIAQKVETVFPEAVTIDKMGIKSVAYSMLIAPIIESIKALNDLIEKKANKTETETQLATQRRQIASSEAKIRKLEAENAALKTYLCKKDAAASICQ